MIISAAFQKSAKTIALPLLVALTVSVSAGEETGLIRLGEDPYTDPEAQHRTAVNPVLVAHKETIVSAFEVGRFVGAGSDNIGWATSTNAGESWTRGFLKGTTTVAGGPWHSIGEPQVAYDLKHQTYLISATPFDRNGDGHGVLVSRSEDGHNWSAPITAASGTTTLGNVLACDNERKSAYYGRCYAATLRYSNGHFVNPVVTSNDGGLTWSAPVSSPDQHAGVPTSIAIQPNGHVFVLGRNGGLDADEAYSIPSLDGGLSWQHTANIAIQLFNFPLLRADPTLTSAVDSKGKIYVVWSDCRFENNCGNSSSFCRFDPTTFFCATNDLVLTTSQDGIDWTPVKRIAIDRTRRPGDQLIPGIGLVNAEEGEHGENNEHVAKLAVTYIDVLNANLLDGTTCKRDDCLIAPYATFSLDGGATWNRPEQVARTMKQSWFAVTNLGEMTADYGSTIFFHCRLYSAFALARPPVPPLTSKQKQELRQSYVLFARELKELNPHGRCERGGSIWEWE